MVVLMGIDTVADYYPCISTTLLERILQLLCHDVDVYVSTIKQ